MVFNECSGLYYPMFTIGFWSKVTGIAIEFEVSFGLGDELNQAGARNLWMSCWFGRFVAFAGKW